jgi:DNA-binding NarL/FixJ family response regulator
MHVVGEATDCTEALTKARQLCPDVILMDINIPGGNGLETACAIKHRMPETKIIILTVHDNNANLLDAIKGGAEGFLGKDVHARALAASVRGVMRGEAAISRQKIAHILKELARLAQIEARQVTDPLTRREIQIFGQLSKGLSNQEIADLLFISENTVKAHVAHIYKKLHVHNRSQAAACAWRLDLYGRPNRTA